ncbi:hypothetical protein CN918_29240 [Priestia megaterium]|nr:hypothetical protein CN918_29240 [Priestia megaterium]
MESTVFSTISEFRKEYAKLRNDIIKRLATDPSGKVKLVRAMQLYQLFDGNWTKRTMVKGTMEDTIRKYEGTNASFKLKTLV